MSNEIDSRSEHTDDMYSESHEHLEPRIKVNKKKRDKNWVPLILPLGCPGKMLAAQLTSLYKWIGYTGFIFRHQADIGDMSGPSQNPCNASDAELFYIDASFVL